MNFSNYSLIYDLLIEIEYENSISANEWALFVLGRVRHAIKVNSNQYLLLSFLKTPPLSPAITEIPKDPHSSIRYRCV